MSMMRTPPSGRRKRSSPLPNPTKRSRLISETEIIEEFSDTNDDQTKTGSQTFGESEKNGAGEAHSSEQTAEENQIGQRTTPSTAKKQKGRPKEIVTQKMLMEAISDPESPIMKALTYALITPLRAAIREEMKTHKESIGKLTEEISSLKTELTEKNNYIANLESRVDDLEQYSRRNCLMITGIPENENEKTDEVVLDMARNQLKAAIDASDIDRSHRIPGGPVRRNTDRPRNIIVKFTTYNARRRVLEKKSSLKGGNNRIYINEHLTKARIELYYEARKLEKQEKSNKHGLTMAEYIYTLQCEPTLIR